MALFAEFLSHKDPNIIKPLASLMPHLSLPAPSI
jgi:hypothetical protein